MTELKTKSNAKIWVLRKSCENNNVNSIVKGGELRALETTEKPTRGVQITLSDMMSLEERGIATRWVGARAVAYDGFPTVGPVFNDHEIINNARCTTQLGSGGVSFAPAVICVSRGSMFVDAYQQDIANKVLGRVDNCSRRLRASACPRHSGDFD